MTYVNFKQLKSRVSMEQVLHRYSVNLKQVNSNYLRGRCPLPSHSSRESRISFTVSRSKNLWSCKSDSCVRSSGKRGGNILDFVALMEGTDFKEAAQKIAEWFPDGQVPPVEKQSAPSAAEGNTKPPAASGNNLPLAFELKGVIYHTWLQDRNISEETAKNFGIGFFPGRGSMSSRVVIPIHNEKGELIAYAGRGLNGEGPKYKLPAGFEKSKVLYNLHRVASNDDCVVVEGFFDVVNLSSRGIPSVALMGRTVSDAQVELLRRFRRVLVMLDGDAPGKESTPAVVAKVAEVCWTRAVMLPDGWQPSTIDDGTLCLPMF